MRPAAALVIIRFATTTSFTPRPILHLTKRHYSPTLPTFSMTKRVLVPIADDCEDIETTCITDTLVRFGAEVVVASVKRGEFVIYFIRLNFSTILTNIYCRK